MTIGLKGLSKVSDNNEGYLCAALCDKNELIISLNCSYPVYLEPIKNL